MEVFVVTLETIVSTSESAILMLLTYASMYFDFTRNGVLLDIGTLESWLRY